MLTFAVDENERNKRIGLRIKMAREAKGWSQDALADELDVKQATVSAWEAGSFPKRLGLPKIAAALDRPIEWFQNDTDGAMAAMERRLKNLEQTLPSPESTLSPEQEIVCDALNDPGLGDERKALALWLLTSETKYLRIFSAEWIARIQKFFAAVNISPRKAQSKAAKKAAR